MPLFYSSKCGSRSCRCRAFTLVELIVIVAILIAVGVMIYPVFYKHGRFDNTSPGMLNQKKLGLAFMQYLQDYDERYPPAVSYIDLSVHYAKPPDMTQQSWGPSYTLADGQIVPGIITAYISGKSDVAFLDPDTAQSKRRHRILEFMYNDLITTQRATMVSSPANTVLLTSGDNRLANVGHALTPDTGSFPATFNSQGGCDAGQGASVREARLRYKGGTFFTFADGHVHWFKGGSDDRVFFPPRSSDSRTAFDPQTHQQVGPVPGPRMIFQGRKYQATFHIR